MSRGSDQRHHSQCLQIIAAALTCNHYVANERCRDATHKACNWTTRL